VNNKLRDRVFGVVITCASASVVAALALTLNSTPPLMSTNKDNTPLTTNAPETKRAQFEDCVRSTKEVQACELFAWGAIIEEDDPRWDCQYMGNHECGPIAPIDDSVAQYKQEQGR